MGEEVHQLRSRLVPDAAGPPTLVETLGAHLDPCRHVDDEVGLRDRIDIGLQHGAIGLALPPDGEEADHPVAEAFVDEEPLVIAEAGLDELADHEQLEHRRGNHLGPGVVVVAPRRRHERRELLRMVGDGVGDCRDPVGRPDVDLLPQLRRHPADGQRERPGEEIVAPACHGDAGRLHGFVGNHVTVGEVATRSSPQRRLPTPRNPEELDDPDAGPPPSIDRPARPCTSWTLPNSGSQPTRRERTVHG